MKYFLRHPDASRFDPPGVDAVRQTVGRVEREEEADVLFVCMARFDGFKFDETLNDIKKPWVLYDWTENGWDDDNGYVWGRNRIEHPSFQDPELVKFDQFVKDHPPLLTFQRELLERDRSDRLLPLDYLSWLPEAGNDTREEFKKRPIEVEFDFGRSHEGRMWLHGAIFQNAGRLGYDVVSEFAHLDRALKDHGRKWLSVHTPHYARLDVRELQKVIRQSVVTVVLPGAGQKTFRVGERAGDSIMAMPRHNLASAYPWNESNSIVLPPIHDVRSAYDACDVLANALMRTDLYELYAEAMANGLNYRPESYCRRHLAANVEKFL